MKILQLTLLFSFFSTFVSAQYQVLWTDQSSATMNGISSDNPEQQTFLSKEEGIRKIKVDDKNRKVYWTNFGSGKLWQANADGSSKKAVIKIDGNISTFTIDQEKELIYYVKDNEERIIVANFDGSDRREFVAGSGKTQGMEVDPRTGKLYWSDIQAGRVMCVPADGIEPELLFESEDMLLYDLAIDHVNDRLYVTDRFYNSINRMDLDGQNFEEILSLDGLAGAICVDSSKGLIYFKEGDKIQQAGLEGDYSYTLVSGVQKLSGIAIFPERENTVAKIEE